MSIREFRGPSFQSQLARIVGPLISALASSSIKYQIHLGNVPVVSIAIELHHKLVCP